LLGSSEDGPPLSNPHQPSNYKSQVGSSPPKAAPAVAAAEVGSPLSGWSCGSDSGGESPSQRLPQQEQVTAANPDGVDDTYPLEFEEEPQGLDELYDTFDGDYGDCVTGIYSEHEEEGEVSEEGEGGADEDEDIIDLCESPPSSPSPQQQLDPNSNAILEPKVEAVEEVEHRACQVCGIELSSRHYLHQVQHVKQCLSKRHLQGGTTKPPQAAAAAVGANITEATLTANKRKYLEMDLKDWLHELQFDAYLDKFISEEIDMTLVHALNENDLSLLGITSLYDQRKFITAAKKVGKEVQAIKRAKRAAAAATLAAAKASSVEASSVDKKQRKKQQTLQELGVSTTASAKPRDGRKINNNNKNVKSAEQALLLNLYPANDSNNYKYVAAPPASNNIPRAATTATEVMFPDSNDAPLPTPPLPPTTALASARVPQSTSLFTSAAHCKQVTETLEARIERRRSERPSGIGGDSHEQLARGGVTFTKVEESRALKAMKLRALKEELRTYENTVAELKSLVAGLEAELDIQQQQPPPM